MLPAAIVVGSSCEVRAGESDVKSAAPLPLRAKVVQATDPKVRIGPERFNADRLAGMLDRALMRLTNTNSAKAAWRALFSPRDVVGLKVNCLAGPRLSSHPVVVDAIARGLRLAGVPDGNVIVWERFGRELTRVGFRLQSSMSAVRYMGIDGQYEGKITTMGSVGSCLAPPINLCTAHINVPVLKDHLLAGLGVGMKNFYGAIHNPNKYHENYCNPYVADVSNIPAIRDRLRLIVCDALNGQYDGGPTLRPGRMWEENALLVARDPVALDTVAGGIIEAVRAAAGLKKLVEVDRPSPWLATANGYELGENDPERIEAIRI